MRPDQVAGGLLFCLASFACRAPQTKSTLNTVDDTPEDAPAADGSDSPGEAAPIAIDLGSRPRRLAEQMRAGALKTRLLSCSGPFHRSRFSVGHRGAPLRFPEHTRESYIEGARQGAGLMECDVTFTKDRELVCRHSQCDLHTTTNILLTDLASKCSKPFVPASPESAKSAASARCCTSDITLKEFKSLCGRHGETNPRATNVEDYVGATNASSPQTCGTLLSHAESIDLIDSLGMDFIPELKAPSVSMPFEGNYSPEQYAAQFIAEYEAAGIDAKRVFPQSFDLKDLLFWRKNTPVFAEQAVLLESRYDDPDFDPEDPSTYRPTMQDLATMGVNFLAPPTWMLVRSEQGSIVPSAYAKSARQAGLRLLPWTLERSSPSENGPNWYWQTVDDVVQSDADVYELLLVLADDVGVDGVFSDWPATVTFFANCTGR